MIKSKLSIHIPCVLSAILFLFVYSYASEKPDGSRTSPQHESGFCGWSTGGECKADSDCMKGGCSGQVCQSKKKALLSQHANGENVIMPINTKSHADVLKADANGVKRNENKKDN